MEKFLFCLMHKFVAKKYLFQANDSAKSSSQPVKPDVCNRNHQNSLRLIEIETKAKVLFSGNLVRDEKQYLFQKEFQLFYAKAVMDLRQNLPFDVTILKYAQFLHPEKCFYIQKNETTQDQLVASVSCKSFGENDLQNVSGPSVRQPRASL